MTRRRSIGWPRWRAALVLLSLAATTPQAAHAQPASLPELATWELDNGMQVAFLRMETAPVVSVQVWYHVGSKDEPQNRRGSAHMFEHMMFRGSERVPPEEHARHIDRLGGHANASTSEDATWYTNVLPREYLDFACRLEAERMRGLLFRSSMIATEREVVKEEIRQLENNPLSQGFLRLLGLAYTRHPYAWTAAGTLADLDATTPADLERFYHSYYVPNNALLVVVGNVTRDEVERAARTWFGPIARGAEPPRPASAATEPPQTAMRREVVAPGHVGLVLGGFRIPAARHDDIHALQIASLLLGAGDASRLHQRLVRQDKVAVQTAAPIIAREHPGLFAVVGAFIDPEKAPQVESALLDEVARLARTPVPDRELRKAKNQVQSSFAFGLETAEGVAQQIGSSWVLAGDPAHWLRTLDRYEAVTAAEIQRVASTYLTTDNLNLIVVPVMGAGQ